MTETANYLFHALQGIAAKQPKTWADRYRIANKDQRREMLSAIWPNSIGSVERTLNWDVEYVINYVAHVRAEQGADCDCKYEDEQEAEDMRQEGKQP